MSCDASAYVDFFEHFKVPEKEWQVCDRVENMGLTYIHTKTRRVILIARRVDEITKETVAYNVYFRTLDNQECVPHFSLDMRVEGETFEDDEGKVLHTLEQISLKYDTEGVLPGDQNDAIEYYRQFLATLGLVQVNNTHVNENAK